MPTHLHKPPSVRRQQQQQQREASRLSTALWVLSAVAVVSAVVAVVSFSVSRGETGLAEPAPRARQLEDDVPQDLPPGKRHPAYLPSSLSPGVSCGTSAPSCRRCGYLCVCVTLCLCGCVCAYPSPFPLSTRFPSLCCSPSLCICASSSSAAHTPSLRAGPCVSMEGREPLPARRVVFHVGSLHAVFSCCGHSHPSASQARPRVPPWLLVGELGSVQQGPAAAGGVRDRRARAGPGHAQR